MRWGDEGKERRIEDARAGDEETEEDGENIADKVGGAKTKERN